MMKKVWTFILFIFASFFALGGIGSFLDKRPGYTSIGVFGVILSGCFFVWVFRSIGAVWALKIPRKAIIAVVVIAVIIGAVGAPKEPNTMASQPAINKSTPKLASSADIRIAKDPFMGGQSDWNMVAGETFNHCKKLLNDPAIVRLHFIFYSPENKNVDWAHVWIKRKDLPANWRDSYLLFFSACKPDAGTVQSTQWLCDFYKKYETARPGGNMPDYCSGYKR